jgi:hypothetical protein
VPLPAERDLTTKRPPEFAALRARIEDVIRGGDIAGDVRGEVWQEPVPPAGVRVAPPPALGAQPLPAMVVDLQHGAADSTMDERQLDVGRVGPVAADVPQVAEAVRRLPAGHLSPVDFATGGRPFVDLAPRPAFQHDQRARLAGRGVARRPPPVDPPRPGVECVMGRAVQVVRQAERLDHASSPGGAVFSANSRNRAAASPHTAVR